MIQPTIITQQASTSTQKEIRDSDAELMGLVQERIPWALEVLFKRYLARGVRQAQNLGLDSQAAEDIVVDAFMKIWNHAEKFQAVRGSFSGWFYTIVHNLAIDELRRCRSRTTAQVQSYIQETGGPHADKENQFLHELERIQVRTALGQLPAAQRELLHMAYVEGLSRREIAKRLALPLGTVHTRVRLGKEKLKRLLQEPKSGRPGGQLKRGFALT
jgi:RNA polymerase sigma-70 factor (ECF subfamily)